jgi:hypothetical protein
MSPQKSVDFWSNVERWREVYTLALIRSPSTPCSRQWYAFSIASILFASPLQLNSVTGKWCRREKQKLRKRIVCSIIGSWIKIAANAIVVVRFGFREDRLVERAEALLAVADAAICAWNSAYAGVRDFLPRPFGNIFGKFLEAVSSGTIPANCRQG